MTSDKDTHHQTTFSLPVKADTFFGKCWWSDEVFPGSQQGYRDFVLISEFSEMEGPVPLAVVSESTYVDLKEYTTPLSSSEQQRQQMQTDLHALGLDRFDFNAFALRVVSTDRGADCYDQANFDTLISNSPATPSSLLDQGIQHDDPDTDQKNNTTQSTFSIPDDTQVYFNDSDLKLYSFTHHLTLFDINARGYVHPVALSYITRDTEKIVSRFEDFMNRFNEVSRLMKKGNYANFMLDLKYRLLDLEYTESTLNNDNKKSQLTVDSNTLSSSVNQSSPVSYKIEKTIPDTKQQTNTKTKTKTSPTPIENGRTPSHATTTTTTTKIIAHHDDLTIALPSTNYNKHHIPTINTDITLTTQHNDQISTTTKQDQHQPPATAPVTRKECLSTQALHQAQMVTRLMLDTMDTYAAQWIRTSYDGETSEDVSTDLDEDSPLSPNLFIDKQQIVESPQTVEPSKDYQPKYVDTLYPVPHFDRKLRSLSQLCHEPDRQQMVQQRRRSSNSGQSHRSLPSTSVIPLVSIIEPQRRKSNKVIKRRLFDKNTKHDMYTEAIKYIKDLTAELGRSSVALELESEGAQLLDPVSQAVSFGRVFMLNLEDGHLRHESSSLPDDYDDLKSNSGTYAGDQHPLSSTPAQTTAATTAITTTSIEDIKLAETDQESSPYYSPLWPTAQLWESNQKQNYGNLLHLLERHKQYIHHIIYALLTGRSVVVMGHPDGKSRIQEIIHALSIFVPGLSKHRHQIVPWYSSEKLKDGSLAAMKLVGTAIENVDPSVYRMDISCLEVDHENGSGHLITSPLYLDGQWIYRMLTKNSLYTADESYIGYLHTIFMEMSLLAYIFYHKYVNETEEEEWDDGFVYPGSALSLDTRYTGKSGQQSSATSHNGSPSEDHRQLGKKWSVRRIMNYLKRVEDGGEPDDYFGPAGVLTGNSSTTNSSPNLIIPSATSNSVLSSSSSTSTTMSTSSTRTNTSVSASSSVSSSPSSASSLLQQRLSALDDPVNGTLHNIPTHILSQLEASAHQTHRQSGSQPQHASERCHQQQTSAPPPPPLQDETLSDHFSEDNEATVTLDSIQNQPPLSVTQLNWNPPSSTEKPAPASTTASPSMESTYNTTAGSSRRTSEAFSDRSIRFLSSTLTSRRNSSSNTSHLSSYDDNDSNTEPWRQFDTDLLSTSSSSSSSSGSSSSSSSSDDDNEDPSQISDRHQQKQQKQPPSSRKRPPVGGFSTNQSDTRSWTSERRGQTFLEQTFHILGDDQAIVMYLANLNRDNNT